MNPTATKKLVEIEEEIAKFKMVQASFDPVSMQKEKQALLKDVSAQVQLSLGSFAH